MIDDAGTDTSTEPFFLGVQQHLDPEHPLLVLSGKIDCKGIDLALAPYYARSGTGRPPKPTRLRSPFCGEFHVVQVPETAGTGRNGEGRDAHPGAAPKR